jgi:hypothetical protein
MPCNGADSSKLFRRRDFSRPDGLKPSCIAVLPIVIGLILSTFMLIGALAHVVARRYSLGGQ